MPAGRASRFTTFALFASRLRTFLARGLRSRCCHISPSPSSCFSVVIGRAGSLAHSSGFLHTAVTQLITLLVTFSALSRSPPVLHLPSVTLPSLTRSYAVAIARRYISLILIRLVLTPSLPQHVWIRSTSSLYITFLDRPQHRPLFDTNYTQHTFLGRQQLSPTRLVDTSNRT